MEQKLFEQKKPHKASQEDFPWNQKLKPNYSKITPIKIEKGVTHEG